MSFWLRLCLGLVLLAPSLAHAQSFLETPSDGDKLSGIGVIRGWKCEAKGDITVTIDDGNPISLVYGSERPTTSGICGDTDNGFLLLINWGIFDGQHTAVFSDDDGEFARSTFTVTTTGVPYLEDADLEDATKCVTVDDFPSTGETTVLEWNTGTQHFEMVESCESPEPEPTEPEPVNLGTCTTGTTVNRGQMCSGSVIGISFTFSVEADGRGCIAGTGLTSIDGCYSDSLPSTLKSFGVDVTRNADGSWTINGLP